MKVGVRLFKDFRTFRWWICIVAFSIFTLCFLQTSQMESYAEPTQDTQNEQNSQRQSQNQSNTEKKQNIGNQEVEERSPTLEPTQKPIPVKDLKSPTQVVCDYFDFQCHINKFLFFTAKSAGDSLNKIFTSLFVIEPSSLKNSTIQMYFNWIKDLSWSFLLLFLTYQIIRILALYSFEVNPGELRDLILRLITASILIGSELWIVEQLVRLNYEIIKSLLDSNTINLIDTERMFGFRHLLFTSAVGVGMRTFPPITAFTLGAACILFFIFVIAVCILFLQLAIRYAEIALLLILGPIVMATIMNKEYNLFPTWWRHLLSAVFTQSIQVLMLVVLIGSVLSIVSGTNIIQNFLLSIGFMVLILRAPKIVQDWMYSSGSTNIFGQVAGQVNSFMKMVK